MSGSSGAAAAPLPGVSASLYANLFQDRVRGGAEAGTSASPLPASPPGTPPGGGLPGPCPAEMLPRTPDLNDCARRGGKARSRLFPATPPGDPVASPRAPRAVPARPGDAAALGAAFRAWARAAAASSSVAALSRRLCERAASRDGRSLLRRAFYGWARAQQDAADARALVRQFGERSRRRAARAALRGWAGAVARERRRQHLVDSLLEARRWRAAGRAFRDWRAAAREGQMERTLAVAVERVTSNAEGLLLGARMDAESLAMTLAEERALREATESALSAARAEAARLRAERDGARAGAGDAAREASRLAARCGLLERSRDEARASSERWERGCAGLAARAEGRARELEVVRALLGASRALAAGRAEAAAELGGGVAALREALSERDAAAAGLEAALSEARERSAAAEAARGDAERERRAAALRAAADARLGRAALKAWWGEAHFRACARRKVRVIRVRNPPPDPLARPPRRLPVPSSPMAVPGGGRAVSAVAGRPRSCHVSITATRDPPTEARRARLPPPRPQARVAARLVGRALRGWRGVAADARARRQSVSANILAKRVAAAVLREEGGAGPAPGPAPGRDPRSIPGAVALPGMAAGPWPGVAGDATPGGSRGGRPPRGAPPTPPKFTVFSNDLWDAPRPADGEDASPRRGPETPKTPGGGRRPLSELSGLNGPLGPAGLSATGTPLRSSLVAYENPLAQGTPEPVAPRR